jgi:hypothetical protein
MLEFIIQLLGLDYSAICATDYVSICAKHGLTPEMLETVRIANDLWPDALVISPADFDSITPGSSRYQALQELYDRLDRIAGRTAEVITTIPSEELKEKRAAELTNMIEKEAAIKL